VHYATLIKIYTIDQWNRIERQEINPFIEGQLIFGKGAKNIQEGKDCLLEKYCLENWIMHV
jgi:hypothetical protein